MENLSQEVQRALQFFFTSTQYHAVDHILLAGGSAVIPGWTRWSICARRCRAAWRTLRRDADFLEVQLKRLMIDAPSLVVACGLAMRRFDPQ